MDDFSRNRKKRWDVIPAIAMIAITFSADIRHVLLPADERAELPLFTGKILCFAG
jgi:hypothetical protein